GSVFGERFWRGGAAALLGDGADARTSGQLDNLLADLVARELLGRRATATLPGEIEYVFRNAALREAAYAMLTEADRSLGHRLAGVWLEQIAQAGDGRAGVDAGALAEHFAIGRDPARAAIWFRRAAEQALEGNDFATALARAERGVRCGA